MDDLSFRLGDRGRYPDCHSVRFTLKTYLLFVAILAVSTGLLIQRAKNQQAVVKHVGDLGGSVAFDEGNLSHCSESDNSLARNLLHGVTSTMIKRAEYKNLLDELKTLPQLKRIIVHGDGEIQAAVIQTDFPSLELVDFNEVLRDLLGTS